MRTSKPGESVVGIDIGGTQIKAVLLESPDRVVAQFECPSRASEGPEGVTEASLSVVNHFEKKGKSFSKIGIGCAGSIDHSKGMVRYSPNFGKFRDVPLARLIAESSKKEVFVENDANCAVYAEWKMGNAKDCSNAVLLTFGTGIGGGLILNERLYRGSTGSAAELGHLSVHFMGIVCQCGNVGCFERYCSASALLQQFPECRTAVEVFKGGAKYQPAVEQFMNGVKVGITSIANVFDPDRILLGGGVAPAVLQHLEEIRQWVKKHAFPSVGENVWIGPALHENMSGALGAALLAANES